MHIVAKTKSNHQIDSFLELKLYSDTLSILHLFNKFLSLFDNIKLLNQFDQTIWLRKSLVDKCMVFIFEIILEIIKSLIFNFNSKVFQSIKYKKYQ